MNAETWRNFTAINVTFGRSLSTEKRHGTVPDQGREGRQSRPPLSGYEQPQHASHPNHPFPIPKNERRGGSLTRDIARTLLPWQAPAGSVSGPCLMPHVSCAAVAAVSSASAPGPPLPMTLGMLAFSSTSSTRDHCPS